MEQLSQLVLLILTAGLIIALIKGGWTGPGGAKTWFEAKFLGRAAA